MTLPIMPKGTAVWLIDNTGLTFEQIAKFCGMHELEVQALADDQGESGITGVDPIRLGQLTKEEIDRCVADPTADLHLKVDTTIIPTKKRKNAKPPKKYTPLIKRQDRPDAVAWLVRYYPDMPEGTIAHLIGATKNTVTSIKSKLRARGSELRPRDPVLLGFCTQVELDTAVAELKRSQEEK